MPRLWGHSQCRRGAGEDALEMGPHLIKWVHRLRRLLAVGSALCAERGVIVLGFGPTPEVKWTVPGHAVDE